MRGDEVILNAACDALSESFKDFTEQDVEQATIRPATDGKVLVGVGEWEVVVEETKEGLRTFTD